MHSGVFLRETRKNQNRPPPFAVRARSVANAAWGRASGTPSQRHKAGTPLRMRVRAMFVEKSTALIFSSCFEFF